MGAGSFAAGLGLAGLDPLPPQNQPRNVSPPAALYFDGASKGFPLDSNGHYLSIHPVDQAVALALLVKLGSLASAPEMGAAFASITKILPSTVATATGYANTALQTFVTNQQIKILDIAVTTGSPKGSFSVTVTYINLILHPVSPIPTAVQVPFST